MSDASSKTPSSKVALVSLGCPKATVDSEHIVTELLDQGVDVVGADDAEAEVLVINTCGFIDAARDESFEAIRSGIAEGREVVVTGCLGAERALVAERFPEVKFISGPAEIAPVVDAVQTFVPTRAEPRIGAPDDDRVRLTPDHYAYLKISEGCNHTCSFCIIPQMRGRLRSRTLDAVLREAEVAVAGGAQELLLIAQDLSAYGLDVKYQEAEWRGERVRTDLYHLVERLGDIAPWVRLHYVYPYPHVDRVIPLMASGHAVPYLDIPLQHASPEILKSMRRPAAQEKTLERIARWRALCPDIALRSTFIVGFPGETDRDVDALLEFLEAAELDRVGCFAYSAVAGAAANALPDHVDEAEKLDRQEAVYEFQSQISARRLARHVGTTQRVLIEGRAGSAWIGRTAYDAPDIDGIVRIEGAPHDRAEIGAFAWVEILDSDDHDLSGRFAGQGVTLR